MEELHQLAWQTHTYEEIKIYQSKVQKNPQTNKMSCFFLTTKKVLPLWIHDYNYGDCKME